MANHLQGSTSGGQSILKDYIAPRFMASGHGNAAASLAGAGTSSNGAARKCADTFDFEGFLHYPASSDPSVLQEYKAQMSQGENQLMRVQLAQAATEPIYSTVALAAANQRELDRSVDRILSATECTKLVQKAMDLQANERYAEAYACFRQAADSSMARLPQLHGDKHKEQEQRIVNLIRWMEALQGIMDEDEEDANNNENRSFRANECDVSSSAAPRGTQTAAPQKQKTNSTEDCEDLEWLNSSLGSIRESKHAAAPDKERRHTGGNGISNHANKSATSLHQKKSSTHSISKEEMSEDIENLKRTLHSVMTGGDTSGFGGASMAYQMSMMITNASFETFGEMKQLQTPSQEMQANWARRTRLLVFEPLEGFVEKHTVTVEAPGGMTREVNRTVPRKDVSTHLPVLREIDTKICTMLKEFDGLAERGVSYTKNTESAGADGKWWVERPVVPQNGLDKDTRVQLETWQLECLRMQETCHKICTSILDSMDIPQSFVDRLPAGGQEILGEDLVKAIARNTNFDVKSYLIAHGQWNERDAGYFVSNLEKVILSWERRLEREKNAKRVLDLNFNRRQKLKNMQLMLTKARLIFKRVRQEFPFMAHTDLQMAKVCANIDNGKAVLEAYGRALEGRAGIIKERLLQIISADIEQSNRKKKTSKR